MAKDSEVFRQSGQLTDHVALGVLSSLIHRDIVDNAIRESGKREARSRLLPADVRSIVDDLSGYEGPTWAV
ncbi:MAG: transposase domain-containing protein [Pseudonocardiaceae bacterium]